MLRRAVVAASAATLVPAGVAGASIKVTADAESPALRVHRVPSRFQVPRYRARLPARTVRMIRSKGVGVFFVTQAPTDLPSEVLGQFGSRVQHALRAFTPEDADALRKTVRTYPTSELYDLEELLTTLAIGEAAVTVLSEKGVPTPVVHTRLRAPQASMAPAADVEGAAKVSSLHAKYGERVDRESAHEVLAARAERAAEPAPREERPAPAKARPPSDALTDFLGSRQGKRLQREIVRGVFGMLRKRL